MYSTCTCSFIDCTQNLFCELLFDFNDHFLKLDNETKLNLMVRLSLLKWEGKYNRTKWFIHIFYSAIKEK